MDIDCDSEYLGSPSSSRFPIGHSSMAHTHHQTFAAPPFLSSFLHRAATPPAGPFDSRSRFPAPSHSSLHSATRTSSSPYSSTKKKRPISLRFSVDVEDIESGGAHRHIRRKPSPHPYVQPHRTVFLKPASSPPSSKFTVRCPGGRSMEYLMLKMQNLSYSADVQEEEEREEEILSLQPAQETLLRPMLVRQPTPYPRSDTSEFAGES